MYAGVGLPGGSLWAFLTLHQGAAAELSPSLLAQLLEGMLFLSLPVLGTNIPNLSDDLILHEGIMSQSTSHEPDISVCIFSPV